MGDFDCDFDDAMTYMRSMYESPEYTGLSEYKESFLKVLDKYQRHEPVERKEHFDAELFEVE